MHSSFRWLSSAAAVVSLFGLLIGAADVGATVFPLATKNQPDVISSREAVPAQNISSMPLRKHIHTTRQVSLNVLNINKTLLFNRVNATVNAALNTRPSLEGAIATASGELGSVRSEKNATKNLARAYWLLNRTVAYNPTNKTQLSAFTEYTYRRLQFESLLKQGYAFTTTSAVPSNGGGVVAAASNITCFVDPSTGIVTNLQQASKLACTAGGQRVVIPSAGKYVTKLEMAIDKDVPLIGRFVFHVRDTLNSKPNVFTCGFAGGDAISLFPPGFIATSVDVGCIPLTPQAIGKRRRRRLSQVPTNAANPELVTAVVLSESIAREESPNEPVSTAVVATGVVQDSTFAVPPSSLSPAVENQLETANNNQTTACPSATPDICSAPGGGNICVSLATDQNRCGSCSNVCPAAQSCVSGTCSCPAPTPDLCGSTCVNFATDNANCGACGNVCGEGTVCQSGQCRCPVIGVVIDVQQTTSSTVVATIACAGAPSSELSFKCVSQGSPKESSGLGTVSYSGSTATVSGLSSCVPYDCYAVREGPGGDVYSPVAPAVTIDDIAFSVANGFTTTNNPGSNTCGNYLQGSIKDQGPGTKWSVVGGKCTPSGDAIGKPFDEQITVVGSEQVWRLSDAVQTTGYGNCPFMQRVKPAGETGSVTTGNAGTKPPSQPSLPAETKRMCSAFTFKSATGTSQPDLSLQANTAGAYNSYRQNFLSIKTGATGFELATSTLLRLTNGTDISTATQIIATVSFADWHRVVTTVEFVDGIDQGPCPAPYESQQCNLGNDIVSIFVDGALAWQGSSWESYYYPPGVFPSVPGGKQAINGFYICPRSGTPSGNAASLGKGLYFKSYGIGISA